MKSLLEVKMEEYIPRITDKLLKERLNVYIK